MAITINALTTGTGGLETTADASGSFSFQSDGTTIATVTSSGFSVTGTFNAGSLQVGGSDVIVDTDIGSTVQAYDAGLTSIAGLTTAANKMIYATASDTYAVTDLTAAGRAILDDADAAAQRTTLGLGTAATTASTDYATAAQGTTADSALQPGDIGSTVQAYDADLTTLAGLSSADGNFIVGSATGWVVESGATVRTSLGLGTAATTASTDYATAAQGTTADSALQPGDIGSTVQAYDADTAKLDVVQTFTANQTFADGVRAFFGTGPDFSIFHDGSNTYLSEYGDGTGNTYLRANNLQLLNNANEIYVNCTSDGTVGLYYDNAIKLGTTSAGVSVTGTCTATAFSGDGSALTNLPSGGGDLRTSVFTSPGTWTNPGSVSYVRVLVIGGGGGAGGNGATSSFGSLLSATGGGSGPGPKISGTGTVSSGTALKSGSYANWYTTNAAAPTSHGYNTPTNQFYQIFASYGGIAGDIRIGPALGDGPAVTYSASNQFVAGAGTFTPGGQAGSGGIAHATNVPVSGPVAVTVGAGGPAGPGRGGASGVVVVEYIG